MNTRLQTATLWRLSDGTVYVCPPEARAEVETRFGQASEPFDVPLANCRTCAHLSRPGLADGYCGGGRSDLPPAYGPGHPTPAGRWRRWLRVLGATMTARTVRPTRRQIAATLAFYGGQPMPAPAAPRQPSARPEADVLRTVLAALRRHPAVAWVERVNSGVVEVDGRWIRYGWVGAADVIGQLADGRFLAVEVKAQAGRVSEVQQAFLDRVNAAGGVAFVARGSDDVAAELGQAGPGLQALAQARTSRHPSATPIARQRSVSQAAAAVGPINPSPEESP